MEKSIREDHNFKAQPHHRLYAVAPHFYFGMLSFPNDAVTQRYRNALTDLCQARSSSKNGFPIEIICGDEGLIRKWHEEYYKKTSDPDLKIAEADRLFEQLISDMNSRGLRIEGDHGQENFEENSLFIRMSSLPDVQFMVIGNKLFEFTMNSVNSSTEIYNTQVISDSRQCNAYVNHFLFIKRLACEAGP